MRPAKSIPTIVKRLQAHRPKTYKEIRALGIPLKRLGDGAFREAYKVVDVPLVIKIPLCECPQETDHCTGACGCPEHSRQEYKVYKKVMGNKKYRALRGFMPKIYYFDDTTGIIAVHYHKQLKATLTNQKFCDLIDQFVRQTLSIRNGLDMKPANVGTEIRNDDDVPTYSFKILDLGFIKRERL